MTATSRPCANCGEPAVSHWVRTGIGSMYCERAGSEDKYDRGTLTPDEQRECARLESALRSVVGVLAREDPGS